MTMRILGPTVRTLDTRTVKLPPKQLNPVYNTPEFKAWARQVVARAGHRCEAVDQHGHRCSRAAPEHRMYADHVVELKDHGSLLDLANGQCLCASHHELKTIKARTRRLMR